MQQNAFFAESHLRTCGGRAGHLPFPPPFRLADLYEEHPPNVSCSSSSSSIGTGSQRSWVRQQPQQQTTNLINFAQLLPQYNQIDEEEEHKEVEKERQGSLNGQEKRISLEREHVSESSPLSPNGGKHVTLFPSEELARLSIDKRHPLPINREYEEQQNPESLPPLIPRRKPTTLTYGHQAPLFIQQRNGGGRGKGGDIRSQDDIRSHDDIRSQEGNLILNGDLSLLLEQPSTPIGNFRPIQASEMFEEEGSYDNNNKTPETASSITTNTTSISERSDPRLQYANPYSRF
uniref:Uncharacterized protein n=1 Tax=Meloidogyne incognita TaxID=6306 RepID=A0A914KNR4_MELIC